MSVIAPGLFSVMLLFPEKKMRIRQMYLQSLSFRTLCRDYGRCERVQVYWRNSDQFCAREISQEYEVLKHSLEKEIKEYLQHGFFNEYKDQLQ